MNTPDENNTGQASQSASNPLPQTPDRRENGRAKISMPVRCQPEEFKYSEEVRSTLNASRGGLYFTTWEDSYYIGMRIRITFPYSSVDPCNMRYAGEVVRIEKLIDGTQGIAIRFLMC